MFDPITVLRELIANENLISDALLRWDSFYATVRLKYEFIFSFLAALASVAHTYIDIFKIENVDNCYVKNGTSLYSGSIFIRNLNATEQLEEQSYQAALKSWHEICFIY
uniref:Uncharacterized protein n=1 Tax=Ascaris lumbricoides TaxID=6252 RepID=A0A0M3I822_ASCLU